MFSALVRKGILARLALLECSTELNANMLAVTVVVFRFIC